jgi:hypothetical protein
VVRNEAGEVVAEVEAEDAPPLPDDWAGARADRALLHQGRWRRPRVKLTGRISHVGLHITYMRQRLDCGELQPGESRTFHTIFYNDTDAAPKDYDVRRISDEAALDHAQRASRTWSCSPATRRCSTARREMRRSSRSRASGSWGADVSRFMGVPALR